ncbi:MAG: response regulator transcription factor [Acidobacteriaceae bacterium]
MQVILADNQEIYRAGMARVLTAQATVRVVAQCSDVAKLLAAVSNLGRSIVIFPSSFTEEIHDLLDRTQRAGSRAVMMLEPEAVLDAGIARRLHGVVMRSVGELQLMDCLYSVAAGERYMQRAVVTTMSSPDQAGLKAVQRLTGREIQIVALICEGMKNKEIAHQLGTKEQVIKNYLRSVYVKTGVSDRLELALFTVHHQALAEVVESTRLAMVRTA